MAKKKADARRNASFNGVGSPGTGSGGGKAYHAAAKAKENISPPTAKNYDGFSGCGGKTSAKI